MRELVDGREVRASERWKGTSAEYRAKCLAERGELPANVVKVTKADGSVSYGRVTRQRKVRTAANSAPKREQISYAEMLRKMPSTQADFD